MMPIRITVISSSRKNRVVQAQRSHIAEGYQHVLILVDAHGHIGSGAQIRPDALNPQIHGIQGQLRQNAGKNGRNPHAGMKQAGHRAGGHSDQKSDQRGNPGIDPVCNQNGGHRASGRYGSVDRQIGHIQDPEGDVNADGHNAPDQSLGDGTGQLVEQLRDIHGRSSTVFFGFRSSLPRWGSLRRGRGKAKEADAFIQPR
jgi:hypothetical protein